MTERPETIPDPASDAARKAGCTCPAQPLRPGYDPTGRTSKFWIATSCPLHGAREFGRERTGKSAR
jgi:hypothetical protein